MTQGHRVRHTRVGETDTWLGDAPVSIDVERDESGPVAGDTAAGIRASEDEIERAWTRLCARNPRLFAGPICAVTAFDPERMRVRWRESTYRHLVVQPGVRTDTWQLSVTALLVLASGRAVLGRRSAHVHTYPGTWEFGPSGGVDPPASGHLDGAALVAEARREIREELSIEAHAPGDILGVFRDSAARSYDVLVRFVLDAETVRAGDGWEYDDVACVPIDRFTSFVRDLPGGLCPPTRGVAISLGWLDPRA